MLRVRRRGVDDSTSAHFFFSSRRRHTRWPRDWSSDVCSSDLHHRRHGPGGSGGVHPGRNHPDRRPAHLHHHRRRPDPGARGGPDRRPRNPRGAAGELRDLPGDRRLPDHRGGAGMSEQRTPATAELTEDEILEMQDSMSGEWGESAPRKAKAFWPSLGRLFGTFGDHKAGLAIVLAFGIISTGLAVWAPMILGDAVDVIFDGVMAGTGIDFIDLGRLLAIVMGMYVVAALFGWL